MEYSPVACMRQSSRCCRSESLGCLPRGFPSAHGGAGLVEAASGASRAGEAVIGVDAILGDAQLQEGLSLGGQILPVGGTARIR